MMAGAREQLAKLQAAYATSSVAGRFAAAAGALAVIAVGLTLVAFGRGLVNSTVTLPPGVGGGTGAQQKAELDKYLAQFNGRTLFFVPGGPRPVEREADKTPPPPPPPEGPPTSYGGPDIIAMVLDTVWFSDGKRLKVGDAPQDELEVVEIVPPWDAVVKWKGGKFTVPLFQRDQIVLKDQSKAEKPGPVEAKKDDAPESTQAKTDDTFVGPPPPDPGTSPNQIATTPKTDDKPDPGASPNTQPAETPPPDPEVQ